MRNYQLRSLYTDKSTVIIEAKKQVDVYQAVGVYSIHRFVCTSQLLFQSLGHLQYFQRR